MGARVHACCGLQRMAMARVCKKKNESIVSTLCIYVDMCKHPLESTEVKLHNTIHMICLLPHVIMQKISYIIHHFSTSRIAACSVSMHHIVCYTHVHMNACVHVYMCTCIHECMCTCIHECMCTCIHVHQVQHIFQHLKDDTACATF